MNYKLSPPEAHILWHISSCLYFFALRKVNLVMTRLFILYFIDTNLSINYCIAEDVTLTDLFRLLFKCMIKYRPDNMYFCKLRINRLID